MKKTRAQHRAANRSFKRDITLSAILHLVILAATVVSSPFDGDRRMDLGEVIRVQLTAAPSPAVSEPAPMKPLQVPSAVDEVLEDVPLTDPSTKEKVAVPEKKPEKPKEQPKPKPKKPQNSQPQVAKTDTTESGGAGQKEIDAQGTGEGSPFAGATIDNATFDYPYWFTQAFNKIAQNYRVPIAYDGTLICVIYFQVIRSGRIIEARVERSSGIEKFDNACLLAVERSAPFPPLPREFREEVIGITIPFKSTP